MVVLRLNVFNNFLRVRSILISISGVSVLAHTYLKFELPSQILSAGNKMFRLPKVLWRGIPSIQTMRIAKMAPEPSMLAMTFHTGPTFKFRPTHFGVYVNRNGERVCNLVISFLFYWYYQI